MSFLEAALHSLISSINFALICHSDLPKQHQQNTNPGRGDSAAAVQVVQRIFIEILRVFYAFNVKLHFIDIFKGSLSDVSILTCCHTAVQQYLLLRTSWREQEKPGMDLIGLY